MVKAAWMIAVVGCAACDAQVGPEYQGEPIAELRGTIQSELRSSPPAAEVILLWLNWQTDPGTVVGTRTPARGEFPAGFEMPIYRPPPDAALNTLPPATSAPEPREGFAWIAVMRAGAAAPGRSVLTHADVKATHGSDVLGWAEDHVLVFVGGAVPEGGFAFEMFGGAIAPGFHLMRASGKSADDVESLRECRRRSAWTECLPLLDPLSEEETGLETRVPVRLVDDLGSLRYPIFPMPPKVEQAFGIAGS